jgi:hypothetical protein
LARPFRAKNYAADVEGQIEAARRIGVNVLAYATNREPKVKLSEAPILAGAKQDKSERAKLSIATIKHNGGWNAAPMALPNLLAHLSSELGIRTAADVNNLSLDDEQLFKFPVIFMHGRNDFTLTDAERKRLKLYIERGGVLVADAICSNEQFAAAFRREINAVFPDQPLEKVTANDVIFTNKFGGFDLRKIHRREPQRRGQDGPLKSTVREVAPELEGVKLGGRYAVLFSRYDISCALERHEALECPGYTREDAARLAINAVLYVLHQ